jgi:nitrate/nitrite-specific signal transduction histidine kinase
MHERARQIRGTLDIASRPGEGTTLTVDAPCAADPHATPGGAGRGAA